MVHTKEDERMNYELHIKCVSDFTSQQRVRSWIYDPPYNIGFKGYGETNDKLSDEDYNDFVELCAKKMFDHSLDDAHMFMVHYPVASARLLPVIEKAGWKIHQWVSWVYPSNIGHSKRKLTTASRALLWFTKGDPPIHIRGVQQPFKNPNDKRIKALIEGGRTGVNLYDWWEINMRKNVSKGHRGWANQLPYKLIENCMLITTEEGEWVGDLTAGSGSLLEVALDHGRSSLLSDNDLNALPLWHSLLGIECPDAKLDSAIADAEEGWLKTWEAKT